jgi:hypothetical protein
VYAAAADADPCFLMMLAFIFCVGRRFFGDSPVNVGIEFDRNSRPSIVKEVL